MPRRSPKTKKVSFTATKRVNIPTRVSFTTKSGKRVRFTASKKVSVPVRVTFYKRIKK